MSQEIQRQITTTKRNCSTRCCSTWEWKARSRSKSKWAISDDRLAPGSTVPSTTWTCSGAPAEYSRDLCRWFCLREVWRTWGETLTLWIRQGCSLDASKGLSKPSCRCLHWTVEETNGTICPTNPLPVDSSWGTACSSSCAHKLIAQFHPFGYLEEASQIMLPKQSHLARAIAPKTPESCSTQGCPGAIRENCRRWSSPSKMGWSAQRSMQN